MDPCSALADGVSTSYSFSMLEMVVLDTAISYTFMCRNKRFILEISAERLEGEGGLVDEFCKFKDNMDDPDIFCDFETWAVDSIDEHIKRLAPAPASSSRMSTTLLEYYSAETYVFELFNRNGVLEAIEHSYDPEIHGDASPKAMVVEPSPLYTSSGAVLFRTPPADPSREESDRSVPGILTLGHNAAIGGIICRSAALPTVPIIPASQFARAAGPESIEEEMCELPRIVRRVDTGREYFFKAAHEGHGLQREVEILAKIQKITEQDPSLRTSRIVGLVNWDGQESLLMGLLLERIEGPTLCEARSDASAADKRRWLDQIDETVSILHKHDLVWGDVRPDSVMIGPSMDAILVGFGGGCTLEYIDLEHREPKEGDLQGLRKMRANFLSGS